MLYLIPGIAHLLNCARRVHDVPPIAPLEYVLAPLNANHCSIPR